MSGLPKGWVETTVGEVCESVADGDHQPPPQVERGIPFITIGAINDGRLDLARATRAVSPEYVAELKTQRRPALDDVLYSVAGTIGRAVLVDTRTPFVFQRHIALLRPRRSVVEPRFLLHVLRSEESRTAAVEVSTGTAQLTLPLSALRRLPLPLPPLAEQRRIVEKLDGVLSRVEACRARLDNVPKLLKRFRQAVLAAATSGELTRDWRGGGEAEWEETTVGEVARRIEYGTSAKSSSEGSVPVLRMGNLRDGRIDWGDLVFTSDMAEIERYRLADGDVLFNRTNSPELVGKSAVFRGARAAVFAGYLVRVALTEALLPELLHYHLASPRGREWCWSVKTDGVSQSNVNASKLGRFSLSLPPLAEQTEIVRRVETLLGYADAVEARYAAARSRLERVVPSVLGKAFRGELVEGEG